MNLFLSCTGANVHRWNILSLDSDPILTDLWLLLQHLTKGSCRKAGFKPTEAWIICSPYSSWEKDAISLLPSAAQKMDPVTACLPNWCYKKTKCSSWLRWQETPVTDMIQFEKENHYICTYTRVHPSSSHGTLLVIFHVPQRSKMILGCPYIPAAVPLKILTTKLVFSALQPVFFSCFILQLFLCFLILHSLDRDAKKATV